MYKVTESGIAIVDNVIVTLEDVYTGEKQIFTEHNAPNQNALDGFAQWLAGVNNVGYNPVPPPTQMQLGSGSGTTFTPVSETLKTISYAKFLGSGSGQTQALAQWVASDPSGSFTQAAWLDINGKIWFLVNFSPAISKTSSQNLTLQWTNTMQAGV